MDRNNKGRTVWLVGLPCSGKTTLGDALLEDWPAIRLDGDHVREGLSAGLGFTVEGRYENIRRCACVAELLNEQGYNVICSFVTPLKMHHILIKSLIKDITLVHVNASAELCEERDVKGMWAKAREGKIKGFTGYDADFDIPECDLIIDTFKSLQECKEKLFDFLINK
jgi:adenylylsulfate kinase